LNALVFLYKKVLKIELTDFNFKPSRKGKQLPVVLGRNEVHKILENLHGEFHLMAALLYGCGLRLNECLGLRVKDIDFDLNEIMIRCGKGDNDRRTLLPELLIPHLKMPPAIL
jgi:integrase